MRVLIKDLADRPHAHAGQVLDLPDAEATDMLARGTAEAAPDEPPADPPAPAEPEPDSEPAPEPAKTATKAKAAKRRKR